jgi:hypothetical protein
MPDAHDPRERDVRRDGQPPVTFCAGGVLLRDDDPLPPGRSLRRRDGEDDSRVLDVVPDHLGVAPEPNCGLQRPKPSRPDGKRGKPALMRE